MTKRRRCWSVAVLVWCLTACQSDRGADASTVAVAPLRVGGHAPAYSATTLTGDTLSIGGTSGQLTLLNVWATWCESCREEFAQLEMLRAAYEAQGLRVVAVSVDQGGEEKVRRFVADQGARFPVARDRDARIQHLYGVVALPSTFLIGRNGRVRWTLTGSFLPDSAVVRKAIADEIGLPQ